MGKVIIVPGLPEEYMVISDNDGKKFALVKIVANALRQHQLGLFDICPTLEECEMQIKALEELGK